MKISLEKELRSKSAERRTELEQFAAVKEVLQITNGDSVEDNRIISGLGGQTSLSIAQEELGKQIELEKIEGVYVGNIFTIDQIKALALDYNLRFLNTNYYKGNMPVEAILKIKEFAKTANNANTIETKKGAVVDLDNDSLNRKFFILAPEENFMLKDREEIIEHNLDPVLFYKVDEKHYRMIYKWGADFTIFRLLSGFKYRNETTNFLFRNAVCLPIAFLFVAFFAGSVFVMSPIWMSIVSILLSFFISSIWFVRKYMSRNGDDGPFKYKSGVFSEDKWNSGEGVVTTKHIYR